jgi:hypothetical protein
MLALQQQTNQKLRDLEIARDEARGLLYSSLTIRDGRSPELLQALREAMLQQIREQIQGVIKAPSDAQPNVLESTSAEIADKVASSQAALDTVKRVSAQQLPSASGPSHPATANENAKPSSHGPSTRERLVASESAATLVGSPGKKIADRRHVSDNPVPDVNSTASSNTRKSTWGDRIARLMSPSKSKRSESPLLVAANAPSQFFFDMASLSCVSHGGSIYLHGLSGVLLLPYLFFLLCLHVGWDTADTPRTSKSKKPPPCLSARSSRKRARRAQRRARYVPPTFLFFTIYVRYLLTVRRSNSRPNSTPCAARTDSSRARGTM